jgi:integrase
MTTRTPKGSIAVVIVRGRVRLRFPRTWYGGEQIFFSLGLPDNKNNRLYAETLAREIEWDRLKGNFDPSFAKYTQVTSEPQPSLTLAQLWAEYCQYKSKSLKPSSMHYLVNAIGVHVNRCPHKSIDKALEVRTWLLKHTTAGMTRRVLSSLATVTKWGIKHQKVSTIHNPFIGMAEEIRIEKEATHANAFNAEERDHIIAAFEQSQNYRHYAPLVKFWFMTGCRPSEGIGLEWAQIDRDCSKILFDRSIVKIGKTTVKNRLSKNNRKRTFPCQQALQDFLLERRAGRNPKIDLVFPSKEGKPIDYMNFSSRAWNKIVDPIIDRHTTPYSCRDTFITDQIGKNVSPAIIAKWVDNSVEMIEKHYLDVSAISHIKPL